METAQRPPGGMRVISPTPPPSSELARAAEENALLLTYQNEERHKRLDAVSHEEQNLHAIERMLADCQIKEQSFFDLYTRLIRSADPANIEAIAQARRCRSEVHEAVSDLVLLRNVAKDRLQEARQSATEPAIRRAAEQRIVDRRLAKVS